MAKTKYRRKKGSAFSRAINAEMRATAYAQRRANWIADYPARAQRAALALQARITENPYASMAAPPGMMGYKGRGAYSLGKAWRKSGLGKTAAGAARSLIGYGVRKLTGGGMYTGHGEYTANSLVGGGVAPEVPQVSSTADETGAVTVSRREYVTDIYAPSSAFNVQSYALNPGLEQSFPWLSQIAQNYDEYELIQCIWTFRSTVTDIGASTTGQCGTVIMATNYNASAPIFGDKVVMMEYDGAMSCKTTESGIHGVECDPKKLSGSAGKYVRASPVLVAQDAKDYDHGLFQLAVANAPAAYANQTIGELWVSYTVKLRKPKFFVARGLGISRDYFVSGNGTESNTFWMGTQAALLRAQQNNIGCALDLSTANEVTITFPAGYAGTLRIVMACEVSVAMSGGINNYFVGGNVAGIFDMYAAGGTFGDAPNQVIGANLLSGMGFLNIFHLRITPATNGVNNTFKITSNMTGATITQSSIDISEYNGNFSYVAQGIGSSQAPILVLNSNTSQVVVP